ncbi:MAG: hypothetical protein CK544_03930 [Planctomycetaceae bacterium]|nr:MAG: hypothetical protein CK544_03930 [Planctomycetaceae bacterium]
MWTQRFERGNVKLMPRRRIDNPKPSDADFEAQAPLDIRTPGLTDALCDVTRLHAWEILRRQAAPITVANLAAACRAPVAIVQRALDAFERAGLARVHPVDTRYPSPRWQSTRQTLVIRFRKDSPEDCALLSWLDSLTSKETERDMLRLAKERHELAEGEQVWKSMHAALLDEPDRKKLWNLMMELERFFYRCNNKYRNSAPDANQDCNYYFSMQFAPLRPGMLPLPTMTVLGGPAVEVLVNKLGGEASTMLTAKETVIAQALAVGRSSKQVADDEGLSIHTVIEHTRRIYRKLGVRTRAQLSAKLSSK